jgi:hypothetical protein
MANRRPDLHELLDGPLNLTVQDPAVSDDDHRIEHLVTISFRADQLVRQPRDRVGLAAAGGVLNQVAFNVSFRTRRFMSFDWSPVEKMTEAAAIARAAAMSSADRFRLYADFFDVVIAAKEANATLGPALTRRLHEKILRRDAMNLAFAKLDALKRAKQTPTNAP